MDNQGNHKRVESGGTIYSKLIFRQLSDATSDACNAPCNTPIRDLASRLRAPPEGMASSSTLNESGFMNSEEYVSDHSSLLSLQPWIFKKEKVQIGEEISKVNCDSTNSCSRDMNALMENPFNEVSPRCVNIGFVNGTSQRSLKSRRSSKNNIKPISSVENCLIPQLYKDDLEFEEYVLDQFSAPTTSAVRPFFITDGRTVISKSRYQPLPSSLEMGMLMDDRITSDYMDNVAGVSSFPKLRTPKRKSRETSNERFDIISSSRTPKLQHSKDLLNQVRLFSIGISVGVISTLLSNKREVDKLNNILKSSESLVQDLQEELELKESMTVKKMTNEASGNHNLDDVIVKVEELFESTGVSVSESNFPTDKEGPKDLPKAELMSQIEAELEAELERLELNMNEHNLDPRMSSPGELDQDFVVDVVHGELRADMFANGDCRDLVDVDSESSGSSTGPMHDANTAVSPRELSIRLHEVIQFRLEQRIKELENELQHSQKQIQLAEVESFHVDRPFSSSDVESSSNQESPNDLAQQLYLNLAGDALDAYDEAYEEFAFATAEENAPPMTSFSNKTNNLLYQSDQSLIWGMESIKYFEEEAPWEHKLRSKGTADDTNLGHKIDEEYDEEDVEGKILIQKIVERTRKGSPAVLHAQRFLFSMEE